MQQCQQPVSICELRTPLPQVVAAAAAAAAADADDDDLLVSGLQGGCSLYKLRYRPSLRHTTPQQQATCMPGAVPLRCSFTHAQGARTVTQACQCNTFFFAPYLAPFVIIKNLNKFTESSKIEIIKIRQPSEKTARTSLRSGKSLAEPPSGPLTPQKHKKVFL